MSVREVEERCFERQPCHIIRISLSQTTPHRQKTSFFLGISRTLYSKSCMDGAVPVYALNSPSARTLNLPFFRNLPLPLGHPS